MNRIGSFIAGLGAVGLGLIAVVSVLTPAMAANPQEMQEVMVFEQTTNKLGDCKLILGKNVAKLVAHSGKLVAVCKAPDWHLVFYNSPRNVGISCTYEVMKRRASGIFAGPPYDKGTTSVRIDPKTGLHQMVLSVSGKAQPEGRNDALIYQVRNKREFASVRYVVADKVALDPHVQSFVKWIFSTAQDPGVPMAFESIFTDGTKDLVYETKSVSRVKMPVSAFAYPKGFKSVTKLIDVAIIEDPKEALETLFGGQ